MIVVIYRYAFLPEEILTAMTSRSFSLFFYGTLMVPDVLHRVIYGLKRNRPSSNLVFCPAILHDHERHRVLGVDYPGVLPRSGKSVRGTLVQNLTSVDVDRLDAFEGDEYERRDVSVTLMEGGETIPAATYIWIAPEDRLAQEEWNFEEFVREKLSRWTGKSEEFKESDAVATGGRSAWSGDAVSNTA